jgi:predicted glycosyltransferase involved in capsule biosynthesis
LRQGVAEGGCGVLLQGVLLELFHFWHRERSKLSKYVQNKNNILQTFLVEFFAVNGVAVMLNTVLTVFIIDVPIFS